MARHLESELQRAVRVLFGAHLRISEVCGLNWADWDSKAELLSIVRQADRHAAGQTVPLKTGDGGQRTIRPLQMALDALQEQQQVHAGIGAVPIFRGPRGGRLRARHLGNGWRAACAVEGIENFHVHDGRHVSLTVIGQTTNSLARVMERGGHRSTKAALRYQSATRDADRAAAMAADEALRRRGG